MLVRETENKSMDRFRRWLVVISAVEGNTQQERLAEMSMTALLGGGWVGSQAGRWGKENDAREGTGQVSGRSICLPLLPSCCSPHLKCSRLF